MISSIHKSRIERDDFGFLEKGEQHRRPELEERQPQ